MRIIVRLRRDDFTAYVEGHPGVCGCGETPGDALQDLLDSNREFLGDGFIQVEDEQHHPLTELTTA